MSLRLTEHCVYSRSHCGADISWRGRGSGPPTRRVYKLNFWGRLVLSDGGDAALARSLAEHSWEAGFQGESGSELVTKS